MQTITTFVSIHALKRKFLPESRNVIVWDFKVFNVFDGVRRKRWHSFFIIKFYFHFSQKARKGAQKRSLPSCQWLLFVPVTWLPVQTDECVFFLGHSCLYYCWRSMAVDLVSYVLKIIRRIKTNLHGHLGFSSFPSTFSSRQTDPFSGKV